ncbi:MAG: type VI secretion system baseplate subunit TssE [Pseudomonadota bacterium]
MSVEHEYAPSTWHRLLAAGSASTQGGNSARVAQEGYRAAVALDLENLLNTRVALPSGKLARYPRCRKSILNYGLMDFAAYCLGSSNDRSAVCNHVKLAIERFEPRLQHVRVELSTEHGAINRIDFHITALLIAPARQPVEFDARLQPSNLRYSVRPGTYGVRTPKEQL